MIDLVAPLFCVCWLLPLGLLAILIVTRTSIATAWRRRGLEDGVIYCANCRFDLRGASTFRCSECGAHLRPGGLLVSTIQPPLGVFAYIALYVVAGFVPVVFILLAIGSTLPFNYQVYRSADIEIVYQNPGPERGTISFSAVSRGTFFGNSEAGVVVVSLSNNLRDRIDRDQALEWYGDAVVDWRDEDQVAQLWHRIAGQNENFTGPADADQARDDFIAYTQALGRGDQAQAQQPAGIFRPVNWRTNRSTQTHQAYIVFMIVTVVIALIMLVLAAVRHEMLTNLAHHETHARLFKRFEGVIEQNLHQISGSLPPEASDKT